MGRKKMAATRARQHETQLATIRDLMIWGVGRNAWMTLNEIAELTEYGEASISAQLRHLRKERHGNYWVEKRPRREIRPAVGFLGSQGAVWEYRVIGQRSELELSSEGISNAGNTCNSEPPKPVEDPCQSA